GMFYSPITGNFYRAYGDRTPPFFLQASLANPPFPSVFGRTLDLPTLRLDLLQWDLQNPYTLQYNLTVQREVLPQTTVLLGYVGSQSVGSGDLNNSFQPRYADDVGDNRGLSDFAIRHNFVFNYSWEVPVGRGATGLAGALLKGWQLSGIFTAHSGVPFTPVLA